MTQFSGPWNTHTDFAEQQWRDLFQNIFSTGVVKGARVAGNAGGDLAVTNPSGLQLSAASGVAITKGFLYYTDAAVTATLAAADPSLPRIDTLIISWSFSGRSAAIAVKQGTPASSPVAPTLTQNDTTYEMPLCDARVNAGATTIASLTDRRMYVGSVGAVNRTGDTMTGTLGVSQALGGSNKAFADFNATDGKHYQLVINTGGKLVIWNSTDGVNCGEFGPAAGQIAAAGATVWTSANDGAGSGLDADTVDGHQPGSGNGLDADTVDGWHIQTGSGVPGTVAANTLYFQLS